MSKDPTIYHRQGPWQILVKMSRVLCEDGVERTIRVREPDTFFTVPGVTHAKGKTITGFVSYDDNLERMVFHATGVNAATIQPKRS